MQPKPSALSPEPFLESLDGLVPEKLHAAAWSRCAGAGWYFGHGSNAGDGSAFWKMDLESDSAFDAIWEHVRPRCEALVETSLRVRRQYANGHTYGLGGRPHKDDGEFTLLYYPNPQWKDGWDGETLFFDATGEISFAVRPRPNRCVLFDAGTFHAGRAPSRACPELRVTVAYKLERGSSVAYPKRAIQAAPAFQPDPPFPPAKSVQPETIKVTRISAQGSSHVYSISVPSALIEQAVQERLATLSRTVRLPGFRPGEIPAAVLKERYGPEARTDILRRMTGEALDRAIPKESVASAVEMKGGAQSGDLEMHVSATYVPDLPVIDFSQIDLERLSADESTHEASGVTQEKAAAYFRSYLKAQVLDCLDSAYPFAVLPSLVEREFSQIWKEAQSQAEVPADVKAQASSEFRAIAERRLRLGWIVSEIGRRNGIHSDQGADLEDKVIDHFVSQARVQERAIDEQELREMMQP